MENTTISQEELAEQEAEEQAVQQRIQQAKGKQRLGHIVDQTRQSERFDTGLKAFQAAQEEAETEESDEAEETEAAETEQEAAEATGEEIGEETDAEEDTEEVEASGEEPEEAEEAEDIQAAYPDWMRERLAEYDPDLDMEDEDAVQRALTHMAEDSKALEQEREANKVVYDLFENNPEMVDLAKNMRRGDSFMVALARTVDLDKAMEELESEDPEEFKEVVRAQVERENKIKAEQERQEKLQKQYEENQEQSENNIQSFYKSKGLDKDEQEEFIGSIDSHLSHLLNGKVTPEFLQVFYRGLNYETDLEQAKEKARIKGKNEKIQSKKTEKKGDGLPNVKNGKPTQKETKEASRGKKALAGIIAGSRSTFGPRRTG